MKGFKYKGRIYKLVKAPKKNECTGCIFENEGDCSHPNISEVWHCEKDINYIAEDVTETLKKL